MKQLIAKYRLLKYLLPFLPVLAALVLLHLGAPESSRALEKQAPKRLKDAAAGDCAACHGTASALPKDHPATKGQGLSQCAECHDGKKAVLLRGKIPLGHLHLLEGVSCTDCHGQGEARAIARDKCLECHDSGEALAKLTMPRDKKSLNPHESPHYGTELDCELCHHAHAKSENYCVQCHDHGVDAVVP